VEVGRGATLRTFSPVELAEFAKYVDTNSEEIKGQLSDALWEELAIANSSIKQQLDSPRPEKKLIGESLSSLRKIAEGATGSLVAGVIRTLLGI
jgi:hypothetical protein